MELVNFSPESIEIEQQGDNCEYEIIYKNPKKDYKWLAIGNNNGDGDSPEIIQFKKLDDPDKETEDKEDKDNKILNPYPEVPEHQKIIKEQPLKAGQKHIDINNPPMDLDEIIKYIRSNHGLVEDAIVVAATSDGTEEGRDKYTIYMYVPKEGSKRGGVTYKIEASIDSSITDHEKINVGSFTPYIHEGQIIAKSEFMIHNVDTDIAFGYEDMTSAQIQEEKGHLQFIEHQLLLKYHQIIGDKTRSRIESLRLANGRVNYIFVYSEMQNGQGVEIKFRIFYEPNTMQILLLSPPASAMADVAEVTELSSQQIKESELVQRLLGDIQKIHRRDINTDYKVQSVAVSTASETTRYFITVSASGVRYRSIWQTGDNYHREVSWSKLMEVAADAYRLDPFAEAYINEFHRLSEEEIHGPEFLTALNGLYRQESIVETCALIGASRRPHNFGFDYKVYKKCASGVIMEFLFYNEPEKPQIKLHGSKALDYNIENASNLPLAGQSELNEFVMAQLQTKPSRVNIIGNK